MIFNPLKWQQAEETPAVFEYTGDHTLTEVNLDGNIYTQYEITSSGTFSVSKDTPGVSVWCCGGGANGGKGTSGYGNGYGGGGGYFAQATRLTLPSGE